MGYAVTYAEKMREDDQQAVYQYGTDRARLDGEFSLDKSSGGVTVAAFSSDDRAFTNRPLPPYLRRVLGKAAQQFRARRFPDLITVY